jgi:hypothetical protein
MQIKRLYPVVHSFLQLDRYSIVFFSFTIRTITVPKYFDVEQALRLLGPAGKLYSPNPYAALSTYLYANLALNATNRVQIICVVPESN